MAERKGKQSNMKAQILNIQKFNVYDGPGVRTIVFFKGCPLRCKWCANPESLDSRYNIMFRENMCGSCGLCVPVCPLDIHKMSDSEHIVNRSIGCNGCSGEKLCELACPHKAISIVGQYVTIDEIVNIVKEDKWFYDTSGGGMTLGGGEPLMQQEAATALLKACKQEGINTTVDTCGYAQTEHILAAA